MVPVDRAAIIERGWAARRLLDSSDFVLVVNALSNEITLDMTATPLGEPGRIERDEHHALLHALKKIVDGVKQFHVTLLNQEHLDQLDGEQSEQDEEDI